MYRSTVESIEPAIKLLDDCRSTVASVGIVLDGGIWGHLDEDDADAFAAPRISERVAACTRTLCDLKDSIEAETGAKAISYEGERGYAQDFEHCSLDDILARACDALHELVSDYMCAEKDLLEALSVCMALEEHLERLGNKRPDPPLKDLADDPEIAFDEFAETLEKALNRPLHEFGIESAGTLSSRIEEAAREGDWGQWGIMRALAANPRAPFFDVERDPIEPILDKAGLVAAALSQEVLGKSLAEIAVEEAGC